MEESIKIPVITEDDKDHTLEFVFDDGTIDIILDGKKICGCDWEGNLKEVFERALKMWE